MISLIRYNLKIIAPTMIWTGVLVAIVTLWNLFYQFHHAGDFTAENAAATAEGLVPFIAAFFAAGVMDWEMKRGAHELLCSKKRPLWHTVAYRLAAALLVALSIGTALVLAYHFGIRHLPLGSLLLAAVPSALCMALISLWTRIRLGNAFGGYLVALGVWVANWILGLIETQIGVQVNPLLTLTSFTQRMHAINAGALDSTPYVDWWWASKIALLVVSAVILFSITRRVEHLVEGDSMPIAARMLSWLRTWTKLALLVLGYFWVGEGYKIVYAFSHDLTRLQPPGQFQISYFQRHFLIESLIHQTWVCGPDFCSYLGTLPSPALLFGPNPQGHLGDYCRERATQLSAFPERYPDSLFSAPALQDGWLYSRGTVFLSLIGGREQPSAAMCYLADGGHWRSEGNPSFRESNELSRRLADGYPDSPQAPQALLRLAEATREEGNQGDALPLYRRIAGEYPDADEAEAAETALYQNAIATGRLKEAQDYQRQALAAAERTARERFARKPTPAKTSLSILGFRLDLASVDLRLNVLAEARDQVSAAGAEVDRLKGISALTQDRKNEVNDVRSRLFRRKTELWVADLFDTFKVEAPGPPPRLPEQDVSGRFTLNGRPFPGVDFLLVSAGNNDGAGLGMQSGGGARFRARSDAAGRFHLHAVPPGHYSPRVNYPTLPAENLHQPVVPIDPGSPDLQMLIVAGKAVTVPEIGFRSAVMTRSFGEVDASADGVTVQWQPVPGAASYQVEVLVAEGGSPAEAFQRRARVRDQNKFRQHPVLWTRYHVSTSHTSCPLLALVPDDPATARFAQYQFSVVALDARGRVLTSSNTSLCRFNFSPQALESIRKLHPQNLAVRRRGFGRRGRGRRGGGGPLPFLRGLR